MMKLQQSLGGTTTIGFPFGQGNRQGIMLGVDARISNSYRDEDKNLYEEIKSDEEVKIFQLCFNPHIYYTLMGDVEEWHKMYKHMLQQAPKSVGEAFDVADNYLTAFRTNNRRSSRIEKAFGMLIAGYQREKGFEILGISIEKKNIIRSKLDRIKALGSGNSYTKHILLAGQNWDEMTQETAADFMFKALLRACLRDVYSGGNLTVIHIHEDGFILATYHVLEVYNKFYDPMDASERKTLFMLYSTNAGPIYGNNAVQTLISDVWPRVNGSGLTPFNHLIAKKACFYIHYIVFTTEQAATRAYVDVPTKNSNPHFPQSLAGIRSFLTNCVRESTRDHVYIGRSSKGLLEGLCNLENAPNLKY